MNFCSVGVGYEFSVPEDHCGQIDRFFFMLKRVINREQHHVG
jgi:hypothetical protein